MRTRRVRARKRFKAMKATIGGDEKNCVMSGTNDGDGDTNGLGGPRAKPEDTIENRRLGKVIKGSNETSATTGLRHQPGDGAEVAVSCGISLRKDAARTSKLEA